MYTQGHMDGQGQRKPREYRKEGYEKMNKKEQALKRIHLLGGLYLLLGVLDLIILVASLLGTKDEISAAFASNGLSQSVNYGLLAVIIAFSAITALLKFYVGYQGVSCTLLKIPNKACRIMTKILLVLSVIGLLSQLAGAFSGEIDFAEISSAAGTLFMIFYFGQSIKELE